MKKKQAAEKPDRHKKKGKTKPGLTFVERRRLAELKHMLAGTNKNAEKPTTAQKTITFQKMYRDGICQVTSGFYTKMVEFYDINYDLLEIEDKGEILEEYSRLINYFDPSIKFELFLFNRQVNEQTLIDQFDIRQQWLYFLPHNLKCCVKTDRNFLFCTFWKNFFKKCTLQKRFSS